MDLAKFSLCDDVRCCLKESGYVHHQVILICLAGARAQQPSCIATVCILAGIPDTQQAIAKLQVAGAWSEYSSQDFALAIVK
jgi:hypothetical protein